MLSIGEFSRVTRLSVKALRLYHQKGILVPDAVRLESRYRYYSNDSVEKARIVSMLKDMGFTLDEIKTILADCRDDKAVVASVEAKLGEVERTLGRYQAMKDNLELFRRSVETGPEKPAQTSDVQIEDVPDVLVCGLRFKGRYAEVGPCFGRLFKACGRAARGKPFSLYYDGEYKDEGADIEACLEVGTRLSAEGLDCRLLRGGRAASIIHHGRYETLSRSYQKLFEYCRERGLELRTPIREVYLKGPGMIFRGHPRRYVTKLMVFLTERKNKRGRGRPAAKKIS